MGAAAIAAGVGAAGAIGGSLISSSAASSAAGKQTAAANAASQRAADQGAQLRGDLASFRDLGENAQARLRGVLGIPGGDGTTLANYGLNGLTFQPTQAELEAQPGYQFTKAQGLNAVANSAAAQGRGISGAALKGAASFATGLADNTLKTQQGIFQQNLGNVLNPLSAATNLGETAAAQTGALGTAATSNANQLAVGGANAAASGIIGSGNALAGGLSGLGNQALNYTLYSKLLGGGSGGGFYGGSPGGGYVDNTSTW